MGEDSEASQDELHQEAEAHLRWLLEESGEFPELPDLDQMKPDQIESLGGGVDAATYLVKRSDGDVVVKLNSEGLESEARALRSWKPYTERVPDVLSLGTVPSSGDPPIKYLLLAALKNDEGDVIETADEFLERSQQTARELGRAGRRAAQNASGAGRDRLRQLRGFTGQRAYLSQLERLPRGLLRAAC